LFARYILVLLSLYPLPVKWVAGLGDDCVWHKGELPTGVTRQRIRATQWVVTHAYRSGILGLGPC